MAKQEEKYGRAFTLKERTGTELSLNTSPEKAGHERVKCADLSLSFQMRGATEIKQLDPGLRVLWDDGAPVFDNLKAPIALGVSFKGTASIGPLRGKETEYDNARMLDFKVTPSLGGELEVRARIRVYLKHETDELYDLVVAGLCRFEFAGKLVIAAKSKDEPDEEQEELPLDGE